MEINNKYDSEHMDNRNFIINDTDIDIIYINMVLF